MYAVNIGRRHMQPCLLAHLVKPAKKMTSEIQVHQCALERLSKAFVRVALLLDAKIHWSLRAPCAGRQKPYPRNCLSLSRRTLTLLEILDLQDGAN